MILRLTFWLTMLIASTTHSLTVIHDTGDTLPLSEYAPKSNEPKQKKEVKPPRMTILPIRTLTMNPGKVTPASHHLTHFQVPLFIFGADPLSKEWLKSRRQELIELNAVGMLVQAETEQDLRDMNALTEGLWVFPASGDDIAKELDLYHYPALISKIGIEQ